MIDKFAAYYNTPERIAELSEYVHFNMHMIMTKMTSEMRRKLDITPDLCNSDGYLSLMTSLYGRLFNELIYGLCGYCQSSDLKLTEILPKTTLDIYENLLNDRNPLDGKPRILPYDKDKFEEFYLKNIYELRSNEKALPK